MGGKGKKKEHSWIAFIGCLWRAPMTTLNPHKWLHLKQSTKKHLQALLSWSLAGTAERPTQKDRRSVDLGSLGTETAQSMQDPLRTAIYTRLARRRGSMIYLWPSAHSWHIHLGHEVAQQRPSVVVSREWLPSFSLPLEKAEQEERKMLLWLEVKKNFLEIKVLNTKRVSIWKSENHLSWTFLSWIVPTVQESNCLNDILLFTVCTILSLSDFFILSLLFLSSSTHFSPTQPFCYRPCLTSTRGPQQCPQATTRNIWHKKVCWILS